MCCLCLAQQGQWLVVSRTRCLLGCWHLCPTQHPARSLPPHALPLPQPSAAAPLVYLGLLESRLKQRSSVLYDPPSLALSCEKREDFQPSSSLPPSGKTDFSRHGKHSAERDRLCDAWTCPLQLVCPYPPGTSQWPPKARAAPGQWVPSSLLAAPWLRGQQGMVGRSCPLLYSLFLAQIGTVQAYFLVNHQAKGHLNLQHLNASQCSSLPPKKLNFPLVHKLSMFSCFQPPQPRFEHDPCSPELPAASAAVMALQHLSTGHQHPAPWRLSEERGSGQTPAQVIAVCVLKFPLQIQPP